MHKHLSDPTHKQSQLVDERYRLLEHIGSGSTADVWRAQHEAIRKPIALKILHLRHARGERQSARLLREGRVAASLQHPGIVRVFDVGTMADGRTYFAMELLSGRTLSEEIRECGAMDEQRARVLFVEVCEALAEAHDAGVWHRDLSPSNIMVLTADDSPRQRCKIIDFGLAKALQISDESGGCTHTGEVIGTPRYMSPEQFKGHGADARSDIYALGCVLYFMLTGRSLFDGTTPPELMYQHLNTPVPKLSKVEISRPQRNMLDAVIARACAKDPTHRFQSVHALMAALAPVRLTGIKGPHRIIAMAIATTALMAIGVSLESKSQRSAGPENCGNGVLDPTEACDDGNRQSADGCEDNCENTRIADLHAAWGYSCIRTERGAVRCWGREGPHLGQPDHVGNIGDDELPSTLPALNFGPLARVNSLSTSFWALHLCATMDDASVRCWGDGGSGELGLGPDHREWGGTHAKPLSALQGLRIPGLVEIKVQHGNTCALVDAPSGTRQLHCWGDNVAGQLGLGHTDSLSSLSPMPVDLGGAGLVGASLGYSHTCVQLDSNALRCFGGNSHYQLGNGLPRDYRVGDGLGDGSMGKLPNAEGLDVKGLGDLEIIRVAPNGGWNCVLSRRGVIRCWGPNTNGSLGYRSDQIKGCTLDGNGSQCFLRTPSLDVDLGDLEGAKIVDLQIGRQRACTLDDRGRVRCWGHVALGYGRALQRTGHTIIGHVNTPAQAYSHMGNRGIVDIGDFDGDGTIDKARRLAVGYSHTCVIAQDDTVRCWGKNGDGELGYGTNDDIGDSETPGEYYQSHRCQGVPVFAGSGCKVR